MGSRLKNGLKKLDYVRDNYKFTLSEIVNDCMEKDIYDKESDWK